MSRDAVAAVLARDDLACGDRLTAFSLASFAGRGHRAWPGAAAAAQRAGLSRSRYLQARDRLVRRGLIVVEAEASGRGRSSTLVLAFAESGPWWEGEINVELLEAVLGYSAATGVARLLLTAMAAIADGDGRRPGLHDRADLCCGRDRGQELPAREDRAARFGRARARERRRRPWEHQRMGRRGPAGAEWRGRSACPAAGRSATGRQAARGHGPLAGRSRGR